MGLLVSFLLLLLLGAAFAVSLRTGTKPSADPLLPYRLAMPREGEFTAATSAALLSSLVSLLRFHGTDLALEVRSAAGRVDYRLYLPESFEPALRGSLAAHFPKARLERMGTGTERPEDGSARIEGGSVLPGTGDEEESPEGEEAPRLFLPFRAERLPEPHPAPVGEAAPLLSVLGTLASLPAPAGFRLYLLPGREQAATRWATGKPFSYLSYWRGALPWMVLVLRSLARTGGSELVLLARTTPPRPSEAPADRPAFEARLLAWSSGEPGAARRSLEALAAQMEAAFPGAAGLRLIPGGNVPDTPLPLETLPAFPLSYHAAGRLFHVPAAGLPFLRREASRQSFPPPQTFPVGAEDAPEVTFGEALTPEGPVPFGVSREARRLHAYVVGQTGTGKSTLLAHLVRQDLEAGRGFALLDPHGDLAERVLSFVPPSRVKDVIYLNPQDAAWPVGYNPLRCPKPEDRPLAASAVLSVLKRLYGEFWGPRMEHILKHALLALLEAPRPSFLDVPRLLTDPAFRHGVLRYVRDPVVRAFFHNEFDRYDARFRNEAIAPILNKVGGYLASPSIRHVVGQSGAALDLRRVMDEGKVLIANLAMGRIGEENAALLGGLLVAGFHLAALSRKDLPEEERRDFGLYADEFQHFAGDAFPSVLSEARKFHLSLVLAHQYLSQVSPSLQEAVFGNVGSLAVFRLGTGDAPRLARELAPSFDAEDLLRLPNHRFCFRTLHGGAPHPAFSARTLPLPNPLPEGGTDPSLVIEASRRQWGRPKAAVELEIADRLEGGVSEHR